MFWRLAWHWAGLLLASAAFFGLFWWIRLPASLLLGPMVAAILFGSAGSPVRVPRLAFMGAQSLVGCIIAHAITAAVVVSVARDGVPMLLVVVSTILAGAGVAWLLGRFGTLSAATAAWGASPGGASAMIVLSEEGGADPRLVAFMQYFRVVAVAVTASLLVRWIKDGEPEFQPAPVPLDLPLSAEAASVAATLTVALVGSWLGIRLRVPAGAVLGPMLLGAVLHATGLVEMTVPEPLIAAAYTVIGWYIGLRFTVETIRHAARAVPEIALATVALIALCGLSAWALVWLRHTDPLTAFLATSPGGIDSAVIIALGAKADVGFVLALQILRVIIVLLTGPALARWLSRVGART